MTRADTLHITEGPVWIIGSTDEDLALLDPLPHGVETIVERDEDEPEDVAAAVIVVDDAATAADTLDELLPRIASVPLVWIALPREARGVHADAVEALVDDYGWSPVERVELDDSWLAVRIEQA